MINVHSWMRDNSVTEEEFREVGCVLCESDPRDMALRVVRLLANNKAWKASADRMREQLDADRANMERD